MAVDITALKSWLLEKAGPHLADQEKQTIETILAKEQVAQVFNEGFAGRSEINRRLDEIRNEKLQLENNLRSELTRYYEGWREGEQTKVNNQVAQIQAQYERDVAALRAQVEAEGLQPSVAQPTKPNGSAQTSNGNGQYLTKQEAAAILREELSKAALYQGVTTNLVERHRQLFGSAPDIREVTDIALRTGRSAEDVWREKYNVAGKEAEIQQATIQKQIDDGVNARLAQLQSDGAMNQQNFTGRPEPPSPIRQMIASQRQQDANSPLAIPQPVMQESSGVRDAVQALQSGKYAVKYPGQA